MPHAAPFRKSENGLLGFAMPNVNASHAGAESAEDLQETIVDLQVRSAYQEQTSQELSDLIFQQQQQIDLLSRRIERLNQVVEELGQGGKEFGEQSELPPHY